MMDFDMLILEALAAEEPKNREDFPAGERKTFLITFDWGERATQGMLEALWRKDFHTKCSDRFPRTTIICRTPKTTDDQALLDLVEETLMDEGSASVARIGGSGVYVWPDRPWSGEKKKTWRRWTA